MDWLFFYYCWVGVHWKGGNLATLTGGRWPTWRQLAIDIAIAIPFWIVWEATAYGVIYLLALLGPNQARSSADLLPKSATEVLGGFSFASRRDSRRRFSRAGICSSNFTQ
jgi:hypothetical protein